MPKTGTRTYSRYTRQAVRLLGLQLHTRRLERGMTAAALAERAGVSRDLLYRVERGDPRVALGLAFELAAIVGVPLFDPDPGVLDAHIRRTEDRLSLLPSAVRKPQAAPADDDF
ncbi:helix-turn-helix transcriptional regulator [Algiphilus aromaticivorans]|uniref:helix-turn-helix transcriptional regulator n=1 Tax=Algiphilus aromaticivorans TaxID=382454 RepID=UPI0005C22BA0|nr:helix-turn-helix transcriptional regulator [Algiphilus aromaticivorans]